MTATQLAPEAEAELFATAAHEFGHHALAVNFGLDSRVLVGNAGNGVCCHDPATPFQTGAIAVAGLLCEDMLGARMPGRKVPNVPLTDETVDKWFDELERDRGMSLSHEDWVGISGAYPRARETCRLAYRILSALNECGNLRWLVEKLAAESRDLVVGVGQAEAERRIRRFEAEHRAEVREAEWAAYELKVQEILARAVPGPPNGFPATLDEFLRVIVAKGGPVDDAARVRFSQFVLHQFTLSGWHVANLERFLKIKAEEYAVLPDMGWWKSLAEQFKAWEAEQQEAAP